MLRDIVLFELKYTLRQPAFWLICLAYFLFALLYASSSISVMGLTTAAINVNSPWAITRMTVQMSYIGLLSIAAFAGASIIRDYRTRIHSILFTTTIRKPDYVLGRFLGGFLACVLAFSFIFIGIAAGNIAPWADPRHLGPFPWETLFLSFAVFALPNMFIGCAFLFALALLTKDTLKTYVAAIAILIGFYISRAFAGAFYASKDSQAAASLIEPFGNYAATMAVLDWTPFERNTVLIWDQSLILVNRAVWVGIAVAVLLIAYRLYKMDAGGIGGRKRRDGVKPVSVATPGKTARAKLDTVFAEPRTGTQFRSLLKFETLQLLRHPAYLVITALTCIGLLFWILMYGRAFGTGFYPHTGMMAEHIHTVAQVPLLAAIVFLSAESLWRSRVRDFDTVMDSLPVPTTAFYISKLFALIAVVAITLAAMILTAIGYQLARGYGDIDLSTYAVQFVAVSLPYFAIFAALSLFLQALVGQRFIAMLLMVVLYVFTLVAIPLGIHSSLVVPGGLAQVMHDDFAGFGHYLRSVDWIYAYWIALAGVLSLIGIAMLGRGTEIRFGRRLHLAKKGLTFRTRGALAVSVLIVTGLGAYVGFNTLLRHPVKTEHQLERLAYEYETLYGDVADETQPKLESVTGTLQLYPDTRHFAFSGTYELVNRETNPLSAFTLTLPLDIDANRIEIDANHRLQRDDSLGVHRVSLDRPLAPGETLTVTFETASEVVEGFRDRPKATPVRRDGSLLFYTDFLPMLGYVRGREIGEPNIREDFGLPERRPVLRTFDDPRGANEQEGQVFADWLSIDMTVETPAGQTSIGQGNLVSDTVIDDRRRRRFVTDVPAKLHMGIAAGTYQMAERRLDLADGPVALEVYHAAEHDENTQALLDTMEQTLTTITETFGSYPYRQLRMVETATRRPNCRVRTDTLLCDSSMGFINDPVFDDPREPPSILVKLPAGMITNLFVQAQIMPANYPGATSIADGLGFYLSSVVWRDQAPPHAQAETVRDVAWKYFMERAKGEEPEGTIVDHVNQTFIGAHKNAISMYALESYIGQEAMHEAISGFLEQHRFRDADFSRMTDVVAAFRAVAEDEVQPIITDLFERRTLFDLAARNGRYKPLDRGGYAVTFDTRAAKRYSSADGELTDAAFDFPVEVVVFGDVVDATGAREILFRDMVEPARILSGSLTLEVEKQPSFAGIDPFYRLLDRNYFDNRVALSPEEETES